MSHPITTQDELDIIRLYAIGFSQREICKGLKHGGAQVSRTLQVKNLCNHIYFGKLRGEAIVSTNEYLQNQIKSLRIYTLLSLLVGLVIGILI